MTVMNLWMLSLGTQHKYRVGSTIRPTCDDYYFTYSGPESITCESTGQWSEEAF